MYITTEAFEMTLRLAFSQGVEFTLKSLPAFNSQEDRDIEADKTVKKIQSMIKKR